MLKESKNERQRGWDVYEEAVDEYLSELHGLIDWFPGVEDNVEDEFLAEYFSMENRYHQQAIM